MQIKKVLLFSVLMIVTGILNAQQWVSLGSGEPVAARVELLSSNTETSTLQVKLGGFFTHDVTTPRGEAKVITVGEATPLLEKGNPDLPKLTASLIIPDRANMKVEVLASDYREFTGIEIAPSKGNLTRDIDPATVPYTYGQSYNTGAFWPSDIAGLREPFIVRDYRGQTVVINPFVYNPITKVLRVYYRITLKVSQEGTSTVNVFTGERSQKVSADFKQIYNRRFLNSSETNRYTPLEEQGKMLIISHGPFIDEMQPFVEWKRTIGIPVEIVDVATIGTNSTAIKSYVADYYANNGLTYLLLVGDNQQVPTVTGSGLGGPSDHAYGYLQGNDHYPDIFVGRFSAENEAHVITQVTRSVMYEKNPDTSTDWFSKGFGIGSAEGTGDDNEYDWEHMRNIRTDLVGYTYTLVAELYDGSQGGEDAPGNPNQASVATEVNAGRSIGNYVGHGSQTAWSTTNFSNTNVNQLTNNNMWPYLFSVACVNGEFMNATCFAEAWLRASNANGPTGAVAALMSTINQSWDPPMEGQDEMNDILTEQYLDNIKRTFGGVSINGCFKMNDTYGSGGSEMTDTWLIFGDPSLMLRTAMPAQLQAQHPNAAFIGSTEFIVECTVNGAYATLTKNGEILGSAEVIDGEAVITTPVLTEVGMIKLAITAFNYLPYITDIEVIPLDGPYVVYESTLINDANANNNQQLDYNETAYLSVTMSNAGNDDAQNITVTLTTSDPYVSLRDSVEVYPLIPANQSVSIADGFNLSISPEIPDGHTIVLNYTAASDASQWNDSFELIGHSVALAYAGMTINDEDGNGNGKVDAGETVLLNFSILNAGTAPAYNVTGMISSEDPYLLVQVDGMNYGTLNGYETLSASYMVTALPTTPAGYQLPIDFAMAADMGFENATSATMTVGAIPVLIIDLDGNKNSGPAIRNSLNNLGITADYVTSWPLVIGPYQSVFICLGTYPNNAALTNGQGAALANYMNNNHGRVYMEGGDTWEFNDPTPAHEMFKIEGDGDGSNDLSVLNGMAGTFTEGMSFTFYGDNNYIDRILPKDTAFVILQNGSPQYNTTIAYNGGHYRTIGSSCEFSGINNGTGISMKDSLIFSYVNFFGITDNAPLLANFIASDTQICRFDEVQFTDYSAGDIVSWSWSFPGGQPETSTEQNPTVIYNTEGTYDVTLVVSDGVNNYTTVKSSYIIADICSAAGNLEAGNCMIYPNPAGNRINIVLNNSDSKTEIMLFSTSGKQVKTAVMTNSQFNLDVSDLPVGMYILKLQNESYSKTEKLLINR